MDFRIENIAEKKLIGKQLTMSFAENKTFQLWSSFMPQQKEIRNKTGTDLYSVEVYPSGFFENFSPINTFAKWAAAEVYDFNEIPFNMQTLIIPTGTYAVFLYKGLAEKADETYRFIFTEWLPKSEFNLDDRPHFAVMSEKYKKDNPDSEEEIWIPVKNKI
jgi:AraC family transcriptional regulator